MFIYFAETADRIKIGIAQDVNARLRALQAGAAQPLNLIGSIKGNLRREQEIHNAIKQYRIKGEWYRDCPEVRATIQNCFNNFDLAEGIKPKNTNFGAAWKAIFPNKSAEHLAALVGCSVRAAAYQISGEKDPSAQAIAALILQVTPDWK